MTDEAQSIDEAPAEEAQAEPTETDYIEFVGHDPRYGTEFHSAHTITRKQLKDAWNVTTPKDLVWTKQEGGPLKGRMLVPVSDMSAEAAAGLENENGFRRVTL